MAALNISTQFTEDLLATVAAPCQRPACTTIIQPGEPRFYVSHVGKSNIPGRHICGKCMAHYAAPERRHATTARITAPAHTATGSNSSNSAPYGVTIDIDAVRRLVNESQRQGHLTTQGRVTAMPPPQHFSQNVAWPQSLPNVQSASLFQNYFGNTPAPMSIGPSGYSIAHAQYEQERERWSKMAYKGPLPRSGNGQIPAHAQAKKEIPILLEVGYLIMNAKVQKTSIKEGIPVDYSISSQEFVHLVKEFLLPPLTKLCPGFPWNFSAMTLRESSSWQDVLQKNPSIPYFQGRFLKVKPGTKSDGSLIFSAPSKPVDFILLIDQEQWLQSERYMEDLPVPTSSMPPVYQVDSGTKKITSSVNKRKTPPSPVEPFSKVKKQTTTIRSPKSMPNLFSNRQETGDDDNTESDGPLPRRFKPLKASQVKKGIFLGGQMAIMRQKREIDSKITEPVACFIINPILYADISESTNAFIQVQDGSKYLGYLSYDLDNVEDFLGKGTFKTARIASLKWISTSPSGDVLGGNMSPLSDPLLVAMKQPYYTSARGLQKRYVYADEAQRTLTEATLLGYAASFLRYSYDFISDFMVHHAKSEPPFSIPQFRFVKGAIAYSEKPAQEGNVNGPLLSHRASYLLEELLPKGLEFVKYIHNADAIPLLDPEQPGYEYAVFFCFIQHLQYVQTHGQVYISDFQGSGYLLTDPQVMTHPSFTEEGILENKIFFGEGNVDEAFSAFTSQHQCNHYCKWFELDPFSSTPTNSDGDEEEHD